LSSERLVLRKQKLILNELILVKSDFNAIIYISIHSTSSDLNKIFCPWLIRLLKFDDAIVKPVI